MDKKYPIGTKIRYKGCCPEDNGKRGTIVGYLSEEIIWVVVPGSYVALSTYKNSKHKWTTYLKNVEVLLIPNQQLLFDFMYYE